jgi:hypothetical protein
MVVKRSAMLKDKQKTERMGYHEDWGGYEDRKRERQRGISNGEGGREMV